MDKIDVFALLIALVIIVTVAVLVLTRVVGPPATFLTLIILGVFFVVVGVLAPEREKEW